MIREERKKAEKEKYIIDYTGRSHYTGIDGSHCGQCI